MIKNPLPLGSPGRVALIGAGAFGRFCIDAYLDAPDLHVVAAADPNPDALAGITSPTVRRQRDWRLLVADPEIEIIHVATPPFLRGDVILAALAAGRSVFAEKPLALTLAEVDRLVAAADEQGATLGIDYVMRHLPAYDALERLAGSRLFGALQSISFANFAQNVPPDHWFWRRELGGGILVEHGVHFFDAYGRVAGPAAEVWGTAPRESAIDVGVRYAGGALGRYYHEFAFPPAIERTVGISMFERGRIEIDGWIPERLTGVALAPAEAVSWVADLPALAVREDGELTRFSVEFPHREQQYREAIVAGMRDVVHRHRDRSWPLRVSAVDARESLALALAAQQAVDSAERVSLSDS